MRFWAVFSLAFMYIDTERFIKTDFQRRSKAILVKTVESFWGTLI